MKNIAKTRNFRTIGITSLAMVTVLLVGALFLTGCPDEEELPEEKRVVSIFAIQGVPAPVIGETPVRTITPTIQYTGTVTWVSGNLDNEGKFIAGQIYIAMITLKTTPSYTLDGVLENSFTVAGTSEATYSAGSGVIMAKFPQTVMTIVNIAAIQGVTIPVIDGTPVNAITSTAQYTGSVKWQDDNSNPVTGKFQGGQVYIATITLTPKPGFTLDGVRANYFTVAGTSQAATNAANSGVITAKFPAASNTINIRDILGVDAPTTGGKPVKAITSTRQYTGKVEWQNAAGNNFTGSSFAGGQVYTATITLTPINGFTTAGVGANFFIVDGARSTINSANSGVITATFPMTETPVTIKAISGITAPVVTEYPVWTITPTDQFTGVITWADNGNIPLTEGDFKGEKIYIATITLTLKEGYTLTGVASKFFTVTGATVEHEKASNIIKATFPITKKLISNANRVIKGISPQAGKEPLTAIPDPDNTNNEYTSKITWKINDTNFTGKTFAAGTAYTAIITLTAQSGYTFERGIAANSFTVEMATLTSNQANSNVITAVFPPTGGITGGTPTRVTIRNITFDPKPVSGVVMKTVKVVKTLQYEQKDNIEWVNQGANAVFSKQTPVTAKITLNANEGFTFSGVTANYFTVEGKQATNNAIPAVTSPANSDQYINEIKIEVTFTPSDGTVSTTNKIMGIAPPKYTPSQSNDGTGTGSVVNRDITTNTQSQYTGKVAWYEKGNAKEFLGNNFGPGMEYTAKITLTANPGYTFSGVTENAFNEKVDGATTKAENGNKATAISVTNPAGSGNTIVVTVVYIETAAIPISIPKIRGVVLPKVGEIPSQIPSDNSTQYTAVITWSSSEPFYAGLEYGAIITVTPKPGFTLEGVGKDFFRVTDPGGTTTEPTVTNSANSGIINVRFLPTDQNPDKTINLSALPKAGTWSNIGVQDTKPPQFSEKTITWSPNPISTSGTFAAGQVYVATITLKLSPGYTFNGIPANYFVVPGTSEPATNAAGSGVITAKFPPTDSTISIAAIQGVTAPVAGATPVTMITETAQYRGTVEWKDQDGTELNLDPNNPNDFVFGASTAAISQVYTATIKLEAKPGFTFYGVRDNFFTVTGSSPAATYKVDQKYDEGTITASFKPTATTITDLNIKLPTLYTPINNQPIRRPPTNITNLSSQFNADIVWFNAANDAELSGNFFRENETYTVRIILTGKSTGPGTNAVTYTPYGIKENGEGIKIEGTVGTTSTIISGTYSPTYKYDPTTGKGTITATFTPSP